MEACHAGAPSGLARYGIARNDADLPRSGMGELAVEPSPPAPAELAEMSLAMFRFAGLVVAMDSEVLGETVVLASDNAALDPDDPRVVYFAADLEDLFGLSGEDLRRLHAVKRMFG